MRKVIFTLCIAFTVMLFSCSKEEELEPKRHDTVYQFNQINFSSIDTLQIARSADSTQVKNIILRVSPSADWEGVNMIGIANELDAMFRNAKGKGVAEGTFRNVDDDWWDRSVEDRIKALGYNIEYSDK